MLHMKLPRFSLTQLFACVTLIAASIALAVTAFTHQEQLREPPGEMRLLSFVSSGACLVAAASILKKGARGATLALITALIGALILLRLHFRT